MPYQSSEMLGGGAKLHDDVYLYILLTCAEVGTELMIIPLVYVCTN
jgi:hypothetical protein